MAAKGMRTDQQPIGDVFFNNIDAANTRVIRSRHMDFPGVRHNSVTVNETDVKGLTVRELKSVLAHEAMHTQTTMEKRQSSRTIFDGPDFEVMAAEERVADHAAARTYGGQTFASALRKMHDNVAAVSPRLAEEMANYTEAARLRAAFPQEAKLKPADTLTVAQTTAGMTDAQSTAWMENLGRRVQQDMHKKGIDLPQVEVVKVTIDRSELPDITSYGKNEITINPAQVARLTVREMQSILAYGMYAATQPDPLSEATAKAGREAAARTYGGRTFSYAWGELHRDGDPHDQLHRRQDEALKTSPNRARPPGQVKQRPAQPL